MFDDPHVYVPIAFVLSCILIAVLSIKFGKAFRQKESDRKRSLAESLGLEYVEGTAALEEAYREAGSMGMQALEWIGRHPGGFVARIAASNFWRLIGQRNGVKVEVFLEVRGSGKNSTTYTVARAVLPRPFEAQCRIAHEGFFTKLGKSLFGLQDLELGDPAFDEAVRIKAKDGLPILSRLAKPEVKESILALLAANHGAFVTEKVVQWEKQGRFLDPGVIGPALELAVRTASALSE
ncbi:MAG TPA: hypothetical protein VMV83_14970 [Rectinemataceae bacterium]|nr:hypothetical protein [Rectinemataceae bacterium]